MDRNRSDSKYLHLYGTS